MILGPGQDWTAWRQEERGPGMTGLQKGIQDLEGMMNSICDWLNFMIESADDFGGWGRK